MTSRERLLATYRRQAKDRVPWVPLISNTTISRYCQKDRRLGPIGFTRSIGADVLWRWGGFVSVTEDVEVHESLEGQAKVRQWLTPHGTLREVIYGERIQEYRLKDITDFPAYRYVLEHTQYVPAYGSYEKWLSEVGDAGIVCPHIGPSAVQYFVEELMGVEAFSYLYADHHTELGELLEMRHVKDLECFRIAAQSPGEVLILVEDTSTLLISPQIYKEWSCRQVTDFCNIAHEHGKVAIVHMCGHIKNLLPYIAETGLDGIDCLTPTPAGDAAADDAWAVIGDDLIVHEILPPTSWIHRSREEIHAAVGKALSSRRDRHFLLCTAADGLDDIPRETWDILHDAVENSRES